MEYLITAVLTILLSGAIVVLIRRQQKIVIGRIIHRQSDMHNILKLFFLRDIHDRTNKSQISERAERDTIKIVAIEDKAYWVVDNVFYVADLINDKPDMSTAKPIDTSNMSKSDIDKMLFILDNLDMGKKDERGSSGN